MLDRWRCGALRRNERPVHLVLGSFRHPTLQHFLVGGGQRLVCRGGRHQQVGIVGADACNQFAVVRFAGFDGTCLDRRLTPVQTQIGLAGGTVRTVALKTLVRQDGAHVAVVLQGLSSRPGSGPGHDETEGTKPRGNHGETSHWDIPLL